MAEKALKLVNGMARMVELGGSWTTFSIANNQSSNANITGLIFDPNDIKAFKFTYVITRQTDSNYRREVGVIQSYYDSNLDEWIEPTGEYIGNNSGVSFFVDTNGQIQYKSTNLSGSSYSGEIQYMIDYQT